jgi:hypothetical protein
MNENQPTLGTLMRWVGERSLSWPPQTRLLGEMNARLVIAVDLLRDRKRPIPAREVKLRTEGLFTSLAEKVAVGQKSTIVRKDTITGKPYNVVIEHTESAWSIREELPNGNKVSEAVVGNDGSTKLTLDFVGDRFHRIRANPGIVDSGTFPSATIKVFALLAKPFLEPDSTTTISAQR